MDSANILSILSTLQQPQPVAPPQAPQMPQQPQADPSNVMQALAQAPQAPMPAPVPAAPPQPVAPPQAPQMTSEPPRRRRSLLDTVGRISDVLAKVGGAEALYQPTLDARQDRELALQDHARTVDLAALNRQLTEQSIATGGMAVTAAENARVGQAARGFKAILASNPQADPATIWPLIAKQAGVPDDQAQTIWTHVAQNPALIDGLIAENTDPKLAQSKYGGSVVYAKDANGVLRAYQPSLSDDGARSILPDGVTPIDPAKFVDTGADMVGVGTRSGNVQRILPKREAPGRAADRTERGREADNRNSTQIKIAGMPARNAGKAGDGGASMGSANMLLDNIERGFTALHGLKALPNDDNNVVGGVAAAIGRTGIGQKIGEQAGNAAAQKRLSIEKDINSLQSEMIKSLPASATRTKFEQEIQRRRMPDPARMSYATAQDVIADLRKLFVQAQKDAAAETAKATPVQRRPAARAASSGWTVVEVK